MSILVDCGPDPYSRYPYLMTSDESFEELLEFGKRLGLRRDWMQHGDGMPHFRITDRKRDKAIQLGAIKASIKEIAAAASRIAKNSVSNCHNLCNPSRPAEGNRTPGFS